MPELPEVEAFKPYIEQCLLQEIKELDIRDKRFFVTSIKDFRKKLIGNLFEFVDRRGKFLIVNLRLYSLKLVFHFGMTGDLSYNKTGTPEEKHVRVVFHFLNGYELRVIDQRRFGKLYLVETIDQVKTIRNMGPEPLEIGEKDFLEICNKHPRRSVKSFLMDQSIIAGLGNMYSDETLFQAGVRPDKKMMDLTEAEKTRIFKRMREILEKMIRTDADFSGFKDFLLLYRRKGANCPRCGGEVENLKMSNRTSYYCPKCQS
ncbi:MAG: DNA-formamidopyrimidine glycosylase [Candidatus Jordarchaeum sp.]|uniref:DNA-formamidopyrimidine glycosylase n=1 Tax=Candidatus Jordarchaeum sp. TaxID=2823881 RepID=UPI0040496D70